MDSVLSGDALLGRAGCSRGSPPNTNRRSAQRRTAEILEKRGFLESKMGAFAMSESRERRVCDFIASMTDRYALKLYQSIFEPRSLV